MIKSKLIGNLIDATGSLEPIFDCIGQCDIYDNFGLKIHQMCDPGIFIANLEGFAVIPLAEWNRLKKIEADAAPRAFSNIYIPTIVPKNNDGRTICFWCLGKTERRQCFSSMYDICPRCKK